ncbi:flavodoxin domain-containing protein [Methanoplanus endosymbiosus]|uniref:Flavodoxin domain-containing protein n=1 Tax=Methanoplanus endosymbiosus TaxID=33865 RepID=A0A9E7PTJ0_9EURY|nr:flavodoxin domain-containing protein [Methanoplanus endosymbiosus]UUX93682.1 flavodoxin domain-containing protein [Methanoplanus endosymbiosus]
MPCQSYSSSSGENLRPNIYSVINPIEEIMNGRILIACATKYGSTYKIAEFMGDELKKTGLSADVYAAEDVNDVSAYNLIVIGSPVYAGKWLPDATNMVQRNLAVLKGKRVAFFTAGISMKDDTPENREKLKEASGEAGREINPVSEGFFAGKITYRELSFLHKIMIKAVKAPEGDFRDWKKIREWTLSLAEYL